VGKLTVGSNPTSSAEAATAGQVETGSGPSSHSSPTTLPEFDSAAGYSSPWWRAFMTRQGRPPESRRRGERTVEGDLVVVTVTVGTVRHAATSVRVRADPRAE
jgi:hypothetical protein